MQHSPPLDYKAAHRSGLIAFSLISVLLLAVLLFFLAAVRFDTKLNAIQSAVEDVMKIWNNIQIVVDELVAPETLKNAPPQVQADMRQKLGDNLRADGRTRAKLAQLFDEIESEPFFYLFADEIAAIRNEPVKPSVRAYVQSLADTPRSMVEARYTSLASIDAILLKSRKALEPIARQRERLAALRRRFTRDSSLVTALVSVALLAGVWASWFAILRPSLNRANVQQQQLAQAEERSRVTLSSIGDAVIVTDAAGRLEQMNPVAEAITGYAFDEVQNEPIDTFFKLFRATDQTPVEHPVHKVLQEGTIIGMANGTSLRTKSGELRLLDDAASPITYPDGRIEGVVLVFRDVTEAYQLQERLRQSEKLGAIGMLASGMAHEFNNGLAVILGASEILDVHLSHTRLDAAKAGTYLQMIKDAVERSRALTDRLLAISRRSDFVRAPIDIVAPIEDAAEILRRTTPRSVEIVIQNKTGPQNAIVEGDFASLQAAFINLGLNSIDAIEGAGHITVSVARCDPDEKTRQQLGLDASKSGFVEISWADDGRGIGPENIARVFEPFYTSKADAGGTGLGLSVVQSTVFSHGGAIDIESEPGHGTVVRIFLPTTVGSAASDAHQRRSRAPANGHGVVLVVDDEPSFLDIAKAYLSDIGFDVLTAANGADAVAAFKQNRERIRVAVLDMNLPKISGSEVARQLRAIDPDCKLIFSTGYVQVDENSAGLRGAVYLRKPYDLARLVDAINKL